MKQSIRGKHRTTLVTQLNKDTNLVKTKHPEVYGKFRFTESVNVLD